uniref:Secreted protein n=1 Tax=Heterorhabditis bacteriophora TaxID=37862 RepID=A0A1I7XPA9_HETBA
MGVLIIFVSIILDAYHIVGSDPSDSLRVPLQGDLQSIVSQMLTRVNDNNSEANQVRKQIFSRKFWRR